MWFLFNYTLILELNQLYRCQNKKEETQMQTFLLIVILILVVINLRQADELRDLERKTLDAFKIVCKKLKQNTEEK